MNPSPPSINPHLDDESLNAWLDGELTADARARAAAHLETCASCGARLNALQSLNVNLAALEAKPIALQIDLSASVAATLRQQRSALEVTKVPLAWRALTVLQILGAAFALVWFAPVTIRAAESLLMQTAQIVDLQVRWTAVLTLLDPSRLPSIPSIALPDGSAPLVWTLAAGVWLAVNAMSILSRQFATAK
jgi:anti-sigma factor RsiW